MKTEPTYHKPIASGVRIDMTWAEAHDLLNTLRKCPMPETLHTLRHMCQQIEKVVCETK
jgi:hypothetical protein